MKEIRLAINVLELFVARFLQRHKKQQKRSKAMVTKNPLAGTDILTEVLIFSQRC
jgi:hypothetical protein